MIAGSFAGRGGLDLQSAALAAGLAEQAAVTVITWTVSRRPRVERKGSVTIVRLPALARLSSDHPAAVAWPDTALRIITGVVGALARRGSYRAILGIGLNPEGVIAAIAGSILRRPMVLYAWTSGPSVGSVPLLERSLLAPLWRRVLSGAKAYAAQTEEIAGDLVRFGFPPDRIHVVPVGVDMQAFAPAGREARRRAKSRLGVGADNVALYHGRFDLSHKRIDLLLSAWRAANLAGWRLVLAGDGPDAGRVQELARHVDPPPVFVKWQDDVRWLLSAADLAVLPTDKEGTSGALAEAMAFGLPVLASRVPAHEHIGPEGVVMVSNELGAWTSALRELGGDTARRAALGNLARSWVERHFNARARIAAFASLLAD